MDACIPLHPGIANLGGSGLLGQLTVLLGTAAHMLPILVDGMKEVNGTRVNTPHLHRVTPLGHTLTARSGLVGCGVVMLLGSFIAWLGGLAHQHADAVPIRAELHGELALPAHFCQLVDNGTMSLSVPLGTCIAGRLAWQAGLACSRGVPCCIPGLYCLPGSLRRQDAVMHCVRPTSFGTSLCYKPC